MKKQQKIRLLIPQSQCTNELHSWPHIYLLKVCCDLLEKDKRMKEEREGRKEERGKIGRRKIGKYEDH